MNAVATENTVLSRRKPLQEYNHCTSWSPSVGVTSENAHKYFILYFFVILIQLDNLMKTVVFRCLIGLFSQVLLIGNSIAVRIRIIDFR